MSESRSRARKHDDILKRAERCVYCPSKGPFTIEHMPPRGMFERKDRPSGWVFACCCNCNQNTRGVDAVAQMFAVIEPSSKTAWKSDKLEAIVGSVNQRAPRVMEELTSQGSSQNVYVNENGILKPAREVKVNGIATRAHLDLFAEKMAMAAFSELCDRPINMNGILFTEWYLNVGMPTDIYHSSLAIMPCFGQLQQGTKVSLGQFSLHYNTDKQGLVGAIIKFQSSLSMLIFATDDEKYVGPLTKILSELASPSRPTSQLTRPGLTKLCEI
ncbi:hypothetical protein [Maritalea porphyrae]|uniref:hypothetical protein n=1 Tax=Maritalea porphyrae TaxID=880732 RepID=UPI0022AE9688|nr:hypothetical protein [Maritalea porphyrae]MCZ4270996.1 hypothetical protein [Maritalea porphyrae]